MDNRRTSTSGRGEPSVRTVCGKRKAGVGPNRPPRADTLFFGRHLAVSFTISGYSLEAKSRSPGKKKTSEVVEATYGRGGIHVAAETSWEGRPIKSRSLVLSPTKRKEKVSYLGGVTTGRG